MTSFVHLDYSTKHPGVARVEAAIDAAQHLRHGFAGGRGLTALLPSAIAVALMVVAYQVMDHVAEGHLMVIWIAMWAAAFGALVFFAGTTRHIAASMKAGLDGWSRDVARSRADERLWATAKSDPRIMADLQCAMIRQEAEVEVANASFEAANPVGLTKRAIRMGGADLRAYQRQYS